MWKRNLLFIGLLLGGAAALMANLAPRRPAARATTEPAPAPETFSTVRILDRVFRECEKEGIKPAPGASDLTVFRRLSLGLTGSIPSLEEVRRFEGRPADNRLSAWLGDALRDRRYADYFAERLARAYVGTEGGPFILFRRRRFITWLSDRVIENRPYDQIVRELIATDGIWTDQPATNFVTVTYDPDMKMLGPERLAARTARAFLGVRLDCAQCHDHPFQPWKQKDFQGLAAFFGQTQTGFTGVHDVKGDYHLTNRKTGKAETIEPRVPFRPELLSGEGNRRAQLARWLTHPDNPNLGRATVNRVWALLFGRPMVEPVDDLPTAGDPPRALVVLADDFVAHGYDLRRLIQVIAATEVFRRESATEGEVSEEQEKTWSVFPLTRLRPEQVAGSVFQAGSLETIDAHSHIITKLTRAIGQSNFVQRYGDTGEDEFDGRSGTIPQSLLLMNGDLVEEKTRDSVFNAATRIAFLAPNDRAAVEIAYLTVLTRRPAPEESSHFEKRLAGAKGAERNRRMADVFWALVNSTEFSWNH